MTGINASQSKLMPFIHTILPNYVRVDSSRWFEICLNSVLTLHLMRCLRFVVKTMGIKLQTLHIWYSEILVFHAEQAHTRPAVGNFCFILRVLLNLVP